MPEDQKKARLKRAREMAEEGKSLLQFAKDQNITKGWAWIWLCENDMVLASWLNRNAPQREKKWYAAQLSRAEAYLDMKAEGASDYKAAQEFGISRQAMSQWLQRNKPILAEVENRRCSQLKRLQEEPLPFSSRSG